jgi:endopolyphosphatase
LTQLNHEIATGQQGDDPRIDFEVEYRTDDDVYQMKDLTVRSFFQLAARIAEEDEADADSQRDSHSRAADWSATDKKKPINSVWRAFLTRAFVGFEDINDLID